MCAYMSITNNIGFPSGTRYTAITEVDPQNYSTNAMLGPTSTRVVCMDLPVLLGQRRGPAINPRDPKPSDKNRSCRRSDR